MAKRKKNGIGEVNVEGLNLAQRIKKRLQHELPHINLDSEPELYLPTGIRIFDEITGGGIPIGVITGLVGFPGSGKSTMAVQTIAALQQKYPDGIGVYIGTERGVTHERLKQLGCDLDRTIYVQGITSMEEVHNFLIKLFEIRLKDIEEYPEAKDIPIVIVWDSVAATRTERVAVASRPEEVTGYQARFVSFLLQKITPYIVNQNIGFIAITHLRDKPDMAARPQAPTLQWLSNKEISGGRAFEFMAHNILFFRARSQLEIERYGFYGTEVSCYSVKNRSYPPKVEIPLILDYAKGFSDLWSCYLLMKRLNLIKDVGAYKQLGNSDKKFHIKKLPELYSNDEEFRQQFDNLFEEARLTLRRMYKLEG